MWQKHRKTCIILTQTFKITLTFTLHRKFALFSNVWHSTFRLGEIISSLICYFSDAADLKEGLMFVGESTFLLELGGGDEKGLFVI